MIAKSSLDLRISAMGSCWKTIVRPAALLRMFAVSGMVCACDGRIDVVLDAVLSGDLGDALALRFLPLDARFPGVLHGEHPPGPLDRAFQRFGVVEIALDDLGTEPGEHLGCVAVRLPRHRAHAVPPPEQFPRHRAALMAARAGDENDVLVPCHGLSAPRSVVWVMAPDSSRVSASADRRTPLSGRCPSVRRDRTRASAARGPVPRPCVCRCASS